MPDPDHFPFEVVPSKRFPGWQALICQRWRPAPVVGWYRLGNPEDEARLAKDLRKLRAIWHQTLERRQKTRAAVAARTKEPLL